MAARLITHGRLATHFSSLRSEPGLAGHMFTEDVPLAITPFRVRNSDDFRVEIIGDAEDHSKTIAVLQSIQEYEQHATSEIVSGAIQEIARRLAWQGRSIYEIIRDNNGELRLQLATSERLVVLPWVAVQFVPRADWKYWHSKLLTAAPQNIWKISIPGALGGFRGYRRILRKLGKSDRIAPQFWHRDLQQGRVNQTFDFSDFRRTTEISEARATRVWGWPRRDFGSENWTEIALFYRILTFRWAQAKLREHIICEINSLLRRLQIHNEIQISGLPSSTDIAGHREAMMGGTMSFKEASDASNIT